MTEGALLSRVSENGNLFLSCTGVLDSGFRRNDGEKRLFGTTLELIKGHR